MIDSEDNKNDDWMDKDSSLDLKVVIEQARMAKRRQEVSCPDIDQTWADLNRSLSTKELKQNDQHRRNRVQLWGAALLGAAAMLAVVFVYNKFFPLTEDASMVVLSYDNSPQDIMLQGDNQGAINLTSKDSISYYPINKHEAMVGSSNNTTAKAINPVMQRLSTPRGMDFKVILPDGSEVWLNASSVIEFPSAFMSGERRVKLQGEAYFKVARDETSPFVVSSENMDIRVLGTEFNMSAYHAEQPYVSLVKGSVEVLNEQTNGQSLVLHPGEEARRTQDGQLHVQKIDTYAVTQWVNGFFYFDNQPLIDVLRELGRWYNLGVVFSRPTAVNKKIHLSTSRHEPIEQALNDICTLLDVKISIKENNIIVQ